MRAFHDFLPVADDGRVREEERVDLRRETGRESWWRGVGADPPAPYVEDSAPNAPEKSFGADGADEEDVDEDVESRDERDVRLGVVKGVEGMRFEVELYGVDIFDDAREGG